jgi:hypothetical protein
MSEESTKYFYDRIEAQRVEIERLKECLTIAKQVLDKYKAAVEDRDTRIKELEGLIY